MPEVAAYLRSLMRSDEFKMAFGERGAYECGDSA